MTAYWVVLAAVALTTLVAAVVGAALAAFAGQALPHAVRHELTTASGTSIAATAPVSGSSAAQATAALKTAIGAESRFYHPWGVMARRSALATLEE
jgi:hypothetical protein